MASEILHHMELQVKEKAKMVRVGYFSKVEAVQVCIPKATVSFKFNGLPLEIQDAIWEIAIDSVEPRVVEICNNLTKTLPGGGFTASRELGSHIPVPGVLQACHRSRQMALETKRWTLSFGNMNGSPGRIFFDFNADILYFGMNFFNVMDFLDDCNEADRLALRKIAFHLDEQYENGYFSCGEVLANRLHNHFPDVEEVIFANENVDFDWNLYHTGELQQEDLDDPKRTIIKFRKPLRRYDKEMQMAAEGEFEVNNWHCPKMTIMDFEKSYPDAEGRPLTETQIRRRDMELDRELRLLAGESEEQLEYELNEELYGKLGEGFPVELGGTDLDVDVSTLA